MRAIDILDEKPGVASYMDIRFYRVGEQPPRVFPRVDCRGGSLHRRKVDAHDGITRCNAR